MTHSAEKFDLWTMAQGHIVTIGMHSAEALQALDVDPADMSIPPLRRAVEYVLTHPEDDFDEVRAALGDADFAEVCRAIIGSVGSLKNSKNWARILRRSAEKFRAENAARRRLERRV
jgi:hypothetical protein